MVRGKRDKIFLSTEERKRLESISSNGYAPTKKILHAQILLLSDEGKGALNKRTDEEIATTLNLHRNTVSRVRKKFLLEGEVPALLA
ncbi:MAG: helix-turn-helix domain-containing protein [Symploca sp. SIO2E6]|nr:helix-turn-helix domain-containing protein [Symploca sp. SIO2E6]